jgi:hypothetical protein
VTARQRRHFQRHCEERSDEAIQRRAKRAKQKNAASAANSAHFAARLPARGWIASLRSQ